MATNIFSSFFRRAPQIPANAHKFPYNGLTNPYRAKREWPPDFTKLSSRYQFRLERRYRRRTKLKWARPVWSKGVLLAHWGSILFVAIYGVFYMEVEETGVKGMTIFDGIRGKVGMELSEIAGTRGDVKKE